MERCPHGGQRRRVAIPGPGGYTDLLPAAAAQGGHLATLRWIHARNPVSTFMCGGVAAAIAGPNAALFWAGVERLKRDLGISGKDLVTFMGNGVAAAIAGPNAALFWAGLSRLNDKLISSGVVRIMCNGVASRTSSPERVDAVLGVLHLTSAGCVCALVHKSPTVSFAEAVHARLQILAPSEHKRFERVVCMGRFQCKRERVRKWLSDE